VVASFAGTKSAAHSAPPQLSRRAPADYSGDLTLIRDDDEERRARIASMLAEVSQVREAAKQQLEHARRTLENSETTIDRLKRALSELDPKAQRKPKHR
jgi:septal ring factor EnvC (AmiA/AmiB activator)